MKSEAEIYKSALQTAYEVYEWSEYGDNDLYRIKDICHSLSENHWKSKTWLRDQLISKLQNENLLDFTVLIQGGWYGLMAHILQSDFDHVISLDADEDAEMYGYKMFGDGIDFQTGNMFNWETDKRIDVIVNTSCEHVDRDDLCDMISKQRNGTVFALQSNDDKDLMSHINTSESLSEFVDYIKPSLPQQDILYVGQLPVHGFTRYMIIGK